MCVCVEQIYRGNNDCFMFYALLTVHDSYRRTLCLFTDEDGPQEFNVADDLEVFDEDDPDQVGTETDCVF